MTNSISYKKLAADIPRTTAFLRDQYRWKNCPTKNILCLIVKWTNKRELGEETTSFDKYYAQIDSFQREIYML